MQDRSFMCIRISLTYIRHQHPCCSNTGHTAIIMIIDGVLSNCQPAINKLLIAAAERGHLGDIYCFILVFGIADHGFCYFKETVYTSRDFPHVG